MAILKIISHGKSRAAKRQILQYVLNPNKTKEQLCHVSGDYQKSETTYQSVYREFERVRNIFGKDRVRGRTYTHGTVAFAPGEVTAEEAAVFASAFAERVYPNHQVLTAVHTDTEHIHAHFVVEPVSYLDGTMLHTSKRDLENAKQICNAMCRERSLSVAQKGYHADGTAFEAGNITAWDKNKWHQMAEDPHGAYLVDLVIAVQDCTHTARNREEFCKQMEYEYGWTVIWNNRKYITFVNSEGKRVRDTNLSKTFHLNITKESLEHEFERYRSGKANDPESAKRNRTSNAKDSAVGNREQMAERAADKYKARR